MTEYQPKYQWHQTQIDEHDPPTDLDWTGMDGKLPIGRIRKELHGPTKGKWQWAAWYPKTHVGVPPAPNLGYEATARLATKRVEDFWEASLRVMKPRRR